MSRLRLRALALLLVLVLPLVVAATDQEPVCPPPSAASPASREPQRERLAVMPLELPRETSTAAIHCPICGVALATGEVMPGAQERLATLIQDWLAANRCFEVMGPAESEGAYHNLLRQTMTATTVGYMRGVGQELKTQAVLGGILYRYRDRVGTAYTVSEAASLGFDLHLIRVADGKVIWSGHFDETQKNLTENVFDIFRFFRRGVRWLTADEFATQAVAETMKDFPRQVGAPEK